jgi:hypothetical protein
VTSLDGGVIIADPLRESWEIVDERTGRPVSVSCYFTEEQALRQIAAWEERDRRGGRPDCHHLVGHMVPRLTRDGREQ